MTVTEAAPISRSLSPRDTVDIRPSRGLFDLDLGSVWRYRYLLQILVTRDLKVLYRQAALGAAWAIIQPVFAVLIFTAVFGRFARKRRLGPRVWQMLAPLAKRVRQTVAHAD